MGKNDAITFVYNCNECERWWAVYAGEALICPECGSKSRTHASTVDPATIITRLLNGEDVLTDLREG